MKHDINTVWLSLAKNAVRIFSSPPIAALQDPLNGPKEISFFCSSEASVNVAELDSSLQVSAHIVHVAEFRYIGGSPVAIVWR
jgi:hypothetical protein